MHGTELSLEKHECYLSLHDAVTAWHATAQAMQQDRVIVPCHACCGWRIAWCDSAIELCPRTRMQIFAYWNKAQRFIESSFSVEIQTQYEPYHCMHCDGFHTRLLAHAHAHAKRDTHHQAIVSCFSKRSYANGRIAKAVADRIRAERGQVMRPYPCAICHMYHLSKHINS